ncbi:phenylalanine--tRNA ligase subunit beta, partial [Dolichospermum sp. ST_sed4]|nr:phenylalanine--tRNA ligase subunit beta [Dolichospermum sp. ST_sed4]
MKFSIAWLKELIGIEISTEKLTQQLTMVGLEVASTKPVAGDFHGVVVGEILEVNSHPNADQLTVCHVNIGESEPVVIVCGAVNVRPKLRVPVAVVGAKLPNNFNILKTKLRGVD